MSKIDEIITYHNRTKHLPYAYAAGPDYLDWESQPNPFRDYDGTEKIDLPFLDDEDPLNYASLFQQNTEIPHPLNKEGIGLLFEYALGLAVWKESSGTRWALRCNPSSGNLHATEGYLVTGDIPDVKGGIYHYNSFFHHLEKRCPLEKITLPQKTILVGLSSIHWREAWKYGERAYRYCQLDIGHAVASFAYSCRLLGWQIEVLTEPGDKDIASLLGIDRKGDYAEAEEESPDLLLAISCNKQKEEILFEELLAGIKECLWQGKANVLSPEHAYEWPVIEFAEKATEKPHTKENVWKNNAFPQFLPTSCEKSAAHIIKTRRSAQAFDGKTTLKLRDFTRMLDMTLPRRELPPWSAFPWKTKANLFVFIHRVDGLEPGLYAFIRNPEALEGLKKAVKKDFLWEQQKNLPDNFPLYLLKKGDFQGTARSISCNQHIASDSAFSLGILAEFKDVLEQGSWNYRRLFWEAGAIGQVLYLEAETVGFRGTGIGCYLDDLFHDLLGLEGNAFQDMYHFTVGTPLVDSRLSDIPPYDHLKR